MTGNAPSSFFQTGAAIFSTPVIDENEVIYIGSGDGCFYAFDAKNSKELWRFKTGGVIDSAAALDGETVYFGSGDGYIYALTKTGQLKWKFAPRDREQSSPSPNYWWEGNVAIGPDGALYAGSDDFGFYCIEKTGKMRWVFKTGLFIWAQSAFDDRGNVYVASFDMNLYALDVKTGRKRWKINLKTPLISSPAVKDDTLYIGGTDGIVYAISLQNHTVIWRFRTTGHIYASPAVTNDGKVIINSTDGRSYGLDARSGDLLWTFNSGAVLRSSPVVTKDPRHGEKYLIYFGGGDGKIYVLDERGQKRWSHDITDQEDKSYHGVCSSLALGKWGLCVGMPNGEVAYLSYDDHEPRNFAVQAKRNWQDLPSSFTLKNMLITKPPIVASLDLIGLSSTQIDATILRQDQDGFTAFGLLKFGQDDQGNQVGVAQSRNTFYLFQGKKSQDGWSLKNNNSYLETTAFQLPLQKISFISSEAGERVEFRSKNRREIFSRLLSSVSGTSNGSSSSGGSPRSVLAYTKTTGTVARMFLYRIWRPWQLFSSDNTIAGSGIFEIVPRKPVIKKDDYKVKFLGLNADKSQISAEVEFDEIKKAPVFALVLTDGNGAPVFLDYNLALEQKTLSGGKVRVDLNIPLSRGDLPEKIKAYLLLESERIGEFEVEIR